MLACTIICCCHQVEHWYRPSEPLISWWNHFLLPWWLPWLECSVGNVILASMALFFFNLLVSGLPCFGSIFFHALSCFCSLLLLASLFILTVTFFLFWLFLLPAALFRLPEIRSVASFMPFNCDLRAIISSCSLVLVPHFPMETSKSNLVFAHCISCLN